ncbi:nucleoside hydrolase [Endozoicomonas numazuensis]|uniref:nucleoside hydrolase n=1 Tax=Endozoicomonas numazuensis TaxID=1137799 RepID=UPI0009DF4886|nr:nucleoside hydrolase [Endozoicomonas numazuensis]
MAKTLSVVIDIDPGIDDAVALLLVWASPELNILGITTVSGSVELEVCSSLLQNGYIRE